MYQFTIQWDWKLRLFCKHTHTTNWVFACARVQMKLICMQYITYMSSRNKGNNTKIKQVINNSNGKAKAYDFQTIYDFTAIIYRKDMWEKRNNCFDRFIHRWQLEFIISKMFSIQCERFLFHFLRFGLLWMNSSTATTVSANMWSTGENLALFESETN